MDDKRTLKLPGAWASSLGTTGLFQRITGTSSEARDMGMVVECENVEGGSGDVSVTT